MNSTETRGTLSIDASKARMKRQTSTWRRFMEQRTLLLLILPAFVITLVFSYAPMFGLYMAFINYSPAGGSFFTQFFTADFVGWHWFEYFFKNDFYMIMRNTLAQSLLSLLFGFPMPILLALMINELRNGWFKKGFQTVSYMPHFISWVIVANMVITLLSTEGVVNNMLKGLGFIDASIPFMQNGRMFWWIIALANTWKDMGFNAIIFLAAITSINPELYEVARVDGASRFRQMLHITLPSLRPTIVVLAILAVGGILNAGFDQQYLLQNNTILNYAEVIDTYTYKYGLQQGMFSYGAAVGLFKSVVAFILLVTVNTLAKKMEGQSVY